MVADPSDHALWFTETAIPAVATLAQPNFTLLGAPLTLSELNGLFNGCHSCLEQYLEQSGAKADPVNPVTGNFTESVSDISVPGRGLPFGFTRTYNSANAGSNGPLGYGWSMGYGASLSPPGGGASMTHTLDSGSTVPFTQQGSAYVPAAPREIAALVHNADGSWTLTLQAREHIAFNTAGQDVKVRPEWLPHYPGLHGRVAHRDQGCSRAYADPQLHQWIAHQGQRRSDRTIRQLRL